MGGRDTHDRLAPVPHLRRPLRPGKGHHIRRKPEIFLPDNSLFHAELIKAGTHSTLHIGENLNHVYPMSPTPEGRRAREEIIRIITGSPAVENRQPDQTDQTGTARTPAVTE